MGSPWMVSQALYGIRVYGKLEEARGDQLWFVARLVPGAHIADTCLPTWTSELVLVEVREMSGPAMAL